MTKLSIKRDLNIIKGKLKQKAARLTGDKLQCVEGKYEELLGRVQKHASKTREAMKKVAGYCSTSAIRCRPASPTCLSGRRDSGKS